MANLCIIPARGGSKRIPRKNIKDFLGKPIIAYSIEAALRSELFDEVMVSTDDGEIAEIAKKFGAKIPFMRTDKNADDYATTADVLIEVLNEYEKKGEKFDFACCVYPTAPLIKLEDLKKGFDLIKNNEYDSVFSAVEFSFPIWRGLRKSSEEKFEMVWPEYLNSRSQDLETVYHDAGQWYWFKPEKLAVSQKLTGSNSSCFILPNTQVQDIDNEVDWRLAELKYEIL